MSVQGSPECKEKFRSEEFVPYELIEFDMPSTCVSFPLSYVLAARFVVRLVACNDKPLLTSQAFPVALRQALDYLY